MARETKTEKEPGRFKQIWSVYKMTRRLDPAINWYLLLSFVVPLGIAVGVGIWLSRTNIVGLILYIVTGIMAGLVVAMFILGRRAERAAYSQAEGRKGAVGSVLKNGLRRGWIGEEEPVNVSPRTQDAIYRAVGRPGVVLVGEGPRSRTQPMLDKERARINRMFATVPVQMLYVGPDEGSLPLHKIPTTLKRFKRKLTKAEVLAVSNRLTAIDRSRKLPIPKGIDPTKVRAPKPR